MLKKILVAFYLSGFSLYHISFAGELSLPATELAKGDLNNLSVKGGKVILNASPDSAWNCARDIFGARAILGDKYEDELVDGDEKTYVFFKEDKIPITIAFPDERKVNVIRICGIAQPELGKLGTVPSDYSATYSLDGKNYQEFEPAIKVIGNTDEKPLHSFTPVSCKYVRIVVSKQNSGKTAKGGRISEIELLEAGKCGSFLSPVFEVDHRAFFERLAWQGKEEYGKQKIIIQSRTADEKDRIRFSPWTTHYEAAASPLREKGKFIQVRGFLQTGLGAVELENLTVFYDMPQSPYIVSGYFLPHSRPHIGETGKGIREVVLAGIKYTTYAVPTKKSLVKMFEKSNLKIFAHCSPQVETLIIGWNKWCKEYPEIRMCNQDETKFGGPCWNNPKHWELFREWMTEKVKKGIENADPIIGAWYPLDEPMWSWQAADAFCFCKSCQAGYKEWLKKEGYTPQDIGFNTWDEVYIPLIGAKGNSKNELHALTRLLYRDTGIANGYRVAKEAIDAADPKKRWSAPTTYNSALAGNASLYAGYDMNQLKNFADVSNIDWYPITSTKYSVFKSRLISHWVALGTGICRPKPFGFVLQSFGGVWGEVPNVPQWRKMCFEAIARGGKMVAPFTYVHSFQKNGDPYPRWHEMKREFNWLSDPVVGTLLMEAWHYGNIAILWPNPWRRHGKAGAPFNPMTEKHFSAEYITTEYFDSPERLTGYQAIYAEVPTVGKAYEMPERRVESLKNYVKNGGILLTIPENKIFDNVTYHQELKVEKGKAFGLHKDRDIEDAMAQIGVYKLYDVLNQDGKSADFVESSLLKGDGYYILFLINFPDKESEVTLTFNGAKLWGDKKILIKDFFTGEKLSLSDQLKLPVKIGAEQVKAFLILTDSSKIKELADWKPVYPYHPYTDIPLDYIDIVKKSLKEKETFEEKVDNVIDPDAAEESDQPAPPHKKKKKKPVKKEDVGEVPVIPNMAP